MNSEEIYEIEEFFDINKQIELKEKLSSQII
jgi:hypothetical protein